MRSSRSRRQSLSSRSSRQSTPSMRRSARAQRLRRRCASLLASYLLPQSGDAHRIPLCSAQSTLTNKSRLKLLHRREEHLQDLFNTARQEITNVSSGSTNIMCVLTLRPSSVVRQSIRTAGMRPHVCCIEDLYVHQYLLRRSEHQGTRLDHFLLTLAGTRYYTG